MKKEAKTTRNVTFEFDDLDTMHILKVNYNNHYTTYTINVRHEEPGKILNLVFKEKDSIIYDPYVFIYHMDPDFVDLFNFDPRNIVYFQGTIQIILALWKMHSMRF